MTDARFRWSFWLKFPHPECSSLGLQVVPFYRFLGKGSPTKIEYRKKGTLILTSLLEDLEAIRARQRSPLWREGFLHDGCLIDYMGQAHHLAACGPVFPQDAGPTT